MLYDNGNKEAVFDVSKLTAFEVIVPSAMNVPQDVPQDVPQEKTLDIWIEGKIRENPKITTEELAKLSGYTSKTIKRHIIKLTHIKYVGSGYSGHWEIIENNA
jgi:ATP-dependent DNA helicase RecG